jgi:hypothetical protein
MKARLASAATLLGMLLASGAAFADADAASLADASAGAADAVAPPKDATGTTPTGLNPCWVEKCPTQAAACKADPDCLKWDECFAKDDQACLDALHKKSPKLQETYKALSECGWKACADPTKGKCSEAGKSGAKTKCGQFDNAWPCNCDDACVNYGDCCPDFDSLCKGAVCGDGKCAGNEAKTCSDDCKPMCGNGKCETGETNAGCAKDCPKASCEARCGQYAQAAPCQCDKECVVYEDCCADYEKLCSGADATSGGTDAVAGGSDATSADADGQSVEVGGGDAIGDTGGTSAGSAAAPAEDSSCSAGRGGGALDLLLLLAGLLGAVFVLRRVAAGGRGEI